MTFKCQYYEKETIIRAMKTYILPFYLLSTITFFCSFTSNAQSKFDGAWWYQGEQGRSSLICEINSDDLIQYTWNSESNQFVTFRSTRQDGYDFVDHFEINKNNATYYWINTCEDCGWTETQIYNIFYVSPHVQYVKYQRHVNNIDVGQESGIDKCWDDEGACFTVVDEGYMRRFPTKVLNVRSIGALGQSYFKPQNLTHTGSTTELTVKISIPDEENLSGYLSEPGSSSAFYLRDDNGNRYDILDQLGFGGFQSQNLAPGEEINLVLIFEKMPEEILSFSLIEGDCTAGCWNAYDIKVEED